GGSDLQRAGPHAARYCARAAENMLMLSGDIKTIRLQMPTGIPKTQQQLPILSIANTEPVTAIPQLWSFIICTPQMMMNRLTRRKLPWIAVATGQTDPCWIWRTNSGALGSTCGAPNERAKLNVVIARPSAAT